MANGMPSNESVVISVGKDYDAQNNSTHIVYLIKDVPDMLVVGPSSNDKEWRQKRAQYTLNNIIRQGEKIRMLTIRQSWLRKAATLFCLM